jgi:hypothetical protein
MGLIIGVGNIVLGLAFLGLAYFGIAEIARDGRARGVSRFGLAYVAMAITCGPHHLISGFQALDGFDVTWMMTVATLIAVPAGTVFVGLRIEAVCGRRGDRFISGTPWWLVTIALGFFVLVGAVAAASLRAFVEHDSFSTLALIPNLVVTITYGAVGVLLFRTQVLRRAHLGGWSLSGLALGAIFPTCALMHLVFSLTASGDASICPADLLGIPASIYFLWVVNRLYRQAIVDWNRRPIVGASRRTERSSPWGRPHPLYEDQLRAEPSPTA